MKVIQDLQGISFWSIRGFVAGFIGMVTGLTMVLVKNSFFYALGNLAVLIFTNYSYRLLQRYNVGHINFYIEFLIVVLNIIGNFVWGIENDYRDGFSSFESQPSTCGNFVIDY